MLIENNIGVEIPAGYRVIKNKVNTGHYRLDLVKDDTKKFSRRNSTYEIEKDLKENDLKPLQDSERIL